MKDHDPNATARRYASSRCAPLRPTQTASTDNQPQPKVPMGAGATEMKNIPRGASSNDSRNVVVFGESGVGKSSLVNIIVGSGVAKTSSGAAGCTFDYSRHEAIIDGRPFGIWDTAGLDEGDYGTVPAAKAEENLKGLLRDLVKANGVDLIVYCVRATRVRKALQKNYNIFYSAICRKKVPIVIVVTGLENYEGEMDGWWRDNEKEFMALNMRFDGHACVTTLDLNVVKSDILLARREESQRKVRDLIVSRCSSRRWSTDGRTWSNAAISGMRSITRSQKRQSPTAPNVILCDITAQETRPAVTKPQKYTVDLVASGGVLRIFRIQDMARGKKLVKKLSTGLLIFCASEDQLNDTRPLDQFYVSYGGEITPMIIVIKGTESQGSTQDRIKSRLSASLRENVDVCYLSEADGAKRQLRELIKLRCLDIGDDVGAYSDDDAHSRSFCCFGRGKGKTVVTRNEGMDFLTRSKIWTPRNP
ncbi:P-loop containing nucleoside triphosphate hydrolase protein [Leucogyrophana mollusca]|uniref:P-loop containing nucleoside triphosphate hydrolase protein n=1 Tax=Leucogyrophana mollusca TaxID=85980 RepID=A0ACB8BVP2_9AGAM|nr:P-loop containing nucleoside triphosphate hydrolase protein [Leucogyrophana mollusca]